MAAGQPLDSHFVVVVSMDAAYCFCQLNHHIGRFSTYWGLVAVLHMMFDRPPIGLAISLACLMLFWVVGLLLTQLYMVREDTSLYVG